METPWERAKKKTKSREQEERGAKMTGARAGINSGRTTWWAPRDFRLGGFSHWLVEARTTDKPFYKIEKKEWEDIRLQGMRMPPGCLPALQPDIQGLQLLVLEVAVFEEMQQYIMQLEEQLRDARSGSQES